MKDQISESTFLLPKHSAKETSSEDVTTSDKSRRIYIMGVLLVVASLAGFVMSLLPGTPILTASSPSQWPLKTTSHPDTPSSLWGVVRMPYPTGAFWTNLVVKDGDGAVGVYPYGVKCVAEGIQVSYGATRRVVTDTAITDTFAVDLEIDAVEEYTSRSVSGFDNISVSMQYIAKGGSYETHLVKGSPYITVVYKDTTPTISSDVMRILNTETRKINSGVVYIVTLGNYQKWFVYCSQNIQFNINENTMTAANSINGFVRVAILPLQNLDSAISELSQYVSRYPTRVSTAVQYQNNQAIVTFKYTTAGSGPLMMLALPHHIDLFSSSGIHKSSESLTAQTNYFPIYCIKGKMIPVIGDTWTLTYNLVDPSWTYDVSTTKVNTVDLNTIGTQLLQDVKNIRPTAADPYTFGKQVGRMAQLALIADNLGIPNARQQALAAVESGLIPWLAGTNPDALVYDRTWGGIITSNGILDPLADYGSGWYNDHHFHYGYFIYAGAAVAKLDRGFLDIHKDVFDGLVKDICGDSRSLDYPLARHKDFFDGHSWASGIVQQSNGKSQESSSEAMHAYYAVKLYAQATENPDLTKFAQLLLTMEIHAARYYWHMPNDNIYDNIFASNRMAGNVGALDVTSSTWFGDHPEFVHGINIMPLTPVTTHSLDYQYVFAEWPVLKRRLPSVLPPLRTQCSAYPVCDALHLPGDCCPTADGIVLDCCGGVGSNGDPSDEWTALAYAAHAVIDAKTSWTEIMSVVNFGPGNSKSNSLYWSATRPAAPTMSPTKMETSRNQSLVHPECTANSACDAMGITGLCCPTYNGVSLACCPHSNGKYGS